MDKYAKLTADQRRYDVRTAGRRMLDKPDQALIDDVFGGSQERYTACVIANFGELTVENQNAA